MKRMKASRIYGYILHQIYNERRSNWALLAELLIVSCIVWYLVDSSYTMIVRVMEPTGFDHTNCYRVELSRFDTDAVGYDPTHSEDDDVMMADRLTILDRLRHDEDIETVAYSERNDPYDPTYRSLKVKYDTLESFPKIIRCQPDFIKIFRYQGIDGKTPEQLAELLTDNSVFVSEGMFGEDIDVRKLVGKEVYVDYDSVPKRVAAVIQPVKHEDREELVNTKVIVSSISQEMLALYKGVSFSIRVKESRVKGFEERFRQKMKGQKIRAGNQFVSDIIPYSKLQRECAEAANLQIRYNTVAIVFFLINVFLGLLGTFWFRTQHRFPEIGLQKAIGATNTDITLRLFAEGVLLLTIAFLPSLVIDLNIAHARLTALYRGETLETGRFLVCAGLAYLLMLLIIGLGIWFPALRAAKANPVEVLRGE